jgi:hypothetical protein
MLRPVLAALPLLLLVATPAKAYIDPGTGSFLVQGIIAAILGAAVALRMYWRRIKALFTRQAPADEREDA